METGILLTGLGLLILLCMMYIIKLIKNTTDQITKQLQLKVMELRELIEYRKGLEFDLLEYRKKHDIDLLAAELQTYRKAILDDLNDYNKRIKDDIDLLASELKTYRENLAKDLQDYRNSMK